MAISKTNLTRLPEDDRESLAPSSPSRLTIAQTGPASVIGKVTGAVQQTAQTAATASNTTGGTTSGGGGGGGGASGPQTPSPSDPTGGPVDGTAPGPVDGDLTAEQLQAIEDTIAAFESQFGLTRAQLLAEQGEIGQTYRLLLAQQQQLVQRQLQGAQAAFTDRGILRSGIAAQGFTDIQQQNAEQQASLIGQQTREQQALDAALATLPQQQQSAILEAINQNLDIVLDSDTLKALIEAGF